ncbi:MAG: hypothetical protein JO263_02640 [Candidatus Eremiobacteraeota bacterium]|nr:hypothetical protein [Candidatus Eremiobacteraeota bacterium]
MKTVRVLFGAGALCLMAVAPAVSATVHMKHPVQVSTCNPERNVRYNYAGYTPAYYPYGYGPSRFWGWPSVYGPTYYQYPVQGEPTLGIDYVNATSVVMKEIEFGLIVRGNLVAEVKDIGTFSPGAEIKHKFGLSPNVFPIQTSFAQCVPLKILFVDGTKWKNPNLPALRASIYGHPQ